jgi:hypothetical protein
MAKLTIIRHETTGNIISVYRGIPHLGLIYCPLPGDHVDWIASPADPKRGKRHFDNEVDAVAYLAGET